MEARLEILEADLAAIKLDVALIKLQGATKSGIVELKASISDGRSTIMMWAVSAVFIAQLLQMINIVKLTTHQARFLRTASASFDNAALASFPCPPWALVIASSNTLCAHAA